MKVIRFAIIGIGSMGFAHAKTLAEGAVDGAALAAAADIDPKRLELAKEQWPDVACYPDTDALLAAGGVDAVIIATPHPCHTELARKVLAAGLPVLSEKPADILFDKVLEAREIAREKGLPYAIMFNQRNNPVYRKLYEMLHSGELGAIKRVNWTVTTWYRTDAYYASGAWRGSWKGEGGGVLLNQAPHNLDMINHLFGVPQKVYAHLSYGKFHPAIDVEDEAILMLSYDGFDLIFSTSTGEYPGSNRMEIACEAGKVVAEGGEITCYRLPVSERVLCASEDRNGPRVKPEIVKIPTPGEDTAHLGILQTFTDHLRYGTPLTADITDGLNEIMLSNAAYLSAWTGEEVSLPLTDGRFARLLRERREADERDITGNADSETGGYSHRWQVKW